MKVVPKPFAFEWDKENSDKNFKRHKITNDEAEQVFKHEPLVSEGIKHSQTEQRLHALGKTDRERLLLVSFTIRGEKARIISAREMNKKERIIYEET